MGSPIVRSSTIAYLVLFSVSLAICQWQGRLGQVFAWPPYSEMLGSLAVGCLAACVVLAGSRALQGTFQWARDLEDEFRTLLGSLTRGDALVLASTSGFAEELFFRATLQPGLGIWVTSIGFGLLHYPANRRMVGWTVLATVLGFMFGIIYDRTGSLLAVALAHALVNYFELMNIVGSGADPVSS